MTPPRALRFIIFIVGFIFTLTTASAAPVKFDISAQLAPTALKEFIKQSGVQVVFNVDDLQDIRTNEVKGEFEPAVALDSLLKGTGFTSSRKSGGIYVVKKTASQEPVTGAVKGSLVGENGKGLANVLVAFRELGQSATTNKYGEYIFPNVAAGTYVLVATAPDYQPLHIVGVTVNAGRELTLGKEEMRKPLGDVTTLEPFIVHADAVTELDKFEVMGTKPKPFATANVDIPRTINDVQPYYIFDAKTIAQSGAPNVGEFMKQRLTMNTVAKTNSQDSGSSFGNLSSINLRGLGTDQTLILVNGRRAANASVDASTLNQPDLNGIPLDAIDRIEVLPSSASGIYGGSAIGGVVNVILKKNYTGGELRAIYENTWNTDSPTRSVLASYGMPLEGGKTHIMLSGAWSDNEPMLLQDRRGIFDENLATILRNSPFYLYSSSSPPLGALTNIVAPSASVPTLILKNGGDIGSRITYVPTGTSPSTSATDLATGLKGNAGSWNRQLPNSQQYPSGLLRPFGVSSKTRSLRASVDRQVTRNLEMFLDFGREENRSTGFDAPSGFLFVPVNSPVNPFTTSVIVQMPFFTRAPILSESVNRSASVGAIVHLPGDWIAELDYSWSDNKNSSWRKPRDFSAFSGALATGAINPFVDTMQFSPNYDKYLGTLTLAGVSTLNDLAARAIGSLYRLPWGTPQLATGIEHRASTIGTQNEGLFPLTPTSNSVQKTFEREQVTDSVYGEITIPLVKQDVLPFGHLLELQIAGRGERYTVDTGSQGYFADSTGTTYYFEPTLNGQPVFEKTRYTSTNGTVGLKYQPVRELTLRASQATAFLPPSPDQLTAYPALDSFPTTVVDPRNGTTVSIQTKPGGNPNLEPQSSKSFNAGAIWEPSQNLLKGLRVNVEYYRIEQKDAIGSLSAQQFVTFEETFPGRVTRNSSGTITLVDVTSVNLYKRVTEGWDISVFYSRNSKYGAFGVQATGSLIRHLETQYTLTSPMYDAVGFPSENGAARSKGNIVLTWERRGWAVGWSLRYFSAYKQYGALGGPDATQRRATNPNASLNTVYTLPQGGDTIPSQSYHDMFLSYAFARKGGSGSTSTMSFREKLTDGFTIHLGVNNAFNSRPPMDALYAGTYFASPYGDMRLRTYRVSVVKQF